MIEHFRPGESEENRRFYGASTQHLDRGVDPCARIEQHYYAILNGKGKLNNSSTGRLFEVVMYDALVAFGVDPDAIRLNAQMIPGWDVEVDILVTLPNHVVALFLKTSIRERWAQAARNAGHLRDYYGHRQTPVKSFLLFVKENKAHTPEQSLKFAARIESKLAPKEEMRVCPVSNCECITELFTELGAFV